MSGYTTGDNNQLTSDGTYNYTYDAEGNRLTRTNISTGYVTEYTWDHRNRLTKVTEKDDMDNVLSTVEHWYDAFNRWIRRSADADGPGGSDPLETIFAYDGNQVSFEFTDDDGTALDGDDFLHAYTWGPMVDQLLVDFTDGDVPQWALTDHLATVRDFVEYDAGMTDTVDTGHRIFDSFGNITSQAGISSLIGFTGRPFDETTGLQNNLNRWYDPAVGRWVSEDPIGFFGDRSNINRYVTNSPLHGTDPLGLAPSAQEPILPALTQPLLPPWFLPYELDEAKWEALYERFGDYYWRYIEYWWPGAYSQYQADMDLWTRQNFERDNYRRIYNEQVKIIGNEIKAGIRPRGNPGALAIGTTAEIWKKLGGQPIVRQRPKPVLNAPTFKTMMKYAKDYWECLKNEELENPAESPDDV